MPIVYLDDYPGFFVEYAEDDQADLVAFVKESLARLVAVPLGREFVAEFVPGEGKPSWGPDRRNCTVGVFAPTKASRTDVAATVDAYQRGLAVVAVGDRKASRITTWWPGSQNTSVMKGILVLPPLQQPRAWAAGNVSMTATPSKKTHEPNPAKFSYFGENQTFFIAFVHELVHAYNALAGEAKQEGIEEEQQTVGLHGFVSRKYTENNFRALFGIRLRNDYKSISAIKADLDIVQHMTPFCQAHHVSARSPKGAD